MSESQPVIDSSRLGAYQLLPHENKAAPDLDEPGGGIAAPRGFDFIGRLARKFAAGGRAASLIASDGAEPAGKRICDRAVVLLRNPKARKATPGDGDASAIESAAWLAARLQSKVAVMEKTIDFLADAEDTPFDKPEVALTKERNRGFAATNYQIICKRLDNTVNTLKPEQTADEIRQTLAETDKANLQDVGEFHSHISTASHPEKNGQNIVHLVVNKTVGVLPESVHESLKDAATWFANLAGDNAVAKVCLKIFAALGMFLAYAVPIALIVASVIFPPIAPITATLAGGATLACPFVACFCGELWKALRDQDTGHDTPDVTLRLLQH